MPDDLDKYYTGHRAVTKCLDALLPIALDNLSGDDESDDFIWLEPSAGDGAFVNQLRHYIDIDVIAIDIAPGSARIMAADFLSWEPPSNKRVIVVGNPPFGKNSSLAIKFFNKAAAFAELIGFVLPRTFLKSSVINRLNPGWSCALSIDLPEDSYYTPDLDQHVMKCVFQVWTKTPRAEIVAPTTHPDFSWTEWGQSDFSVRRVGGLAGKVFDYGYRSRSSHYFIKANVEGLQARFESLFVRFQSQAVNAAGNPSLSKSEIVAAYSELLKQEAS